MRITHYDDVIDAFALGGAIILLALVFGCSGSDAPTAPDVSPVEKDAVVSQADTSEPQTVQPQNENDPSFSVAPDGKVTIFNASKSPLSKALCYFWAGDHPQELIQQKDVTVPPGQRREFRFPISSQDIPEELCGDQRVQVDVANACTVSDNLPGLVAWNWVTVPERIPCCDEEPVLISEEWSGLCIRLDAPGQDACVEYGVATYDVCGMTVQREIRRGCECGEDCEPPAESAFTMPLGAAGNPEDECAAYGPYVPVCKTENGDCQDDTEAEFYVCKQSTWMIATEEYQTPCPVIEPEGWSHVTGCICD